MISVEMMLPPGLNEKQHWLFRFSISDQPKPYCSTGFHTHDIQADQYANIIAFNGCTICPLAASAIANYWDDFKKQCLLAMAQTSEVCTNKTEIFNQYKIAVKQTALWKRAARGEHIENAVIVPLKWE